MLAAYVKRTLDSIFTSLDRCPQPLRDIFAHMQAEVIRKCAPLTAPEN